MVVVLKLEWWAWMYAVGSTWPSHFLALVQMLLSFSFFALRRRPRRHRPRQLRLQLTETATSRWTLAAEWAAWQAAETQRCRRSGVLREEAEAVVVSLRLLVMLSLQLK